MPNETPEKCLLAAGAVGLAPDRVLDVLDIFWNEVRQPAVLEIAPHLLDRIERRRVRRKRDRNPADRSNGADSRWRCVDASAVEKDDRSTPGKSLQVAYEPNYLWNSDILLRMKGDEEADSATFGRNHQRPDSRDLGVRPLLDPDLGRLASPAPRSPKNGGHQEAGFVEQNQARAEPCDVFFTAGQVFVSQIRTRWSLRSLATLCGRCGESPELVRRRAM